MQENHREFDGIQVVQFARSSLELARDFVPRQHLLLPLVCDPEGQWYDRYGVRSSFRDTLLNPASFLAYFSRLSWGHGAPEGAYGQSSAAFVVAPTGELRWVWYGRGIFELPDVSVLKEAVRA